MVLSGVPGQAAPPEPTAAGRIFQDDCEIYLHEVVDQQPRRTIISGQSLENQPAIACRGYVCGVELFSRRGDLKIDLDGRPFEVTPDGPARYRYTYFPKIRGDALWAGDDFAIEIDGAAGRRKIAVRHQGARLLRAADPVVYGGDGRPVFRLLGESPEHFQVRGRDFEARLAAVTDGVRYVQRHFGVHLVDQVDLLAVIAGDNALTLRGHRKIWLYAKTFWGESLPELRAMAEHETLHLVVDQAGFTARPAIRTLFADLRGFDPLSTERFALVTSGWLPGSATCSPTGASPMLDFINERNYFPGLSGGHAADNLEEFCTSLLHALLYADRLAPNLQRRHLVTAVGDRRRLSSRQKQQIAQDLTNTLARFTAESTELAASRGVEDPLGRSLEALFQSAGVAASGSQPPGNP